MRLDLSKDEVRALIAGDLRYNVTPKDIKISADMAGSFGKAEVEESAGRLVLFLQSKDPDKWQPFSLMELIGFYQSKKWDPNTALFGLLGIWSDNGAFGGLIRSRECFINYGDKMVVTNEFIKACAKMN